MNSLDFIKEEMLVHVPICTHADPKRILSIGAVKGITHETEKHIGIETHTALTAEEAEAQLKQLDGRYDVIIIADAKLAADHGVWQIVNTLIDDKGVVSAISVNPITQAESIDGLYRVLGENYEIVMPYRYEGMGMQGELASRYMVLASHFYHPTADFNLQRADLTDGLEYYNCDIAVAAFAMPTFISKQFLGVVKR